MVAATKQWKTWTHSRALTKCLSNRPRSAGKVSCVVYDFCNAYANILAGRAECQRIFGNANSLAALEEATGHVLVISKVFGFPTMLDMPGLKATDLNEEVPRLANAV